MLNLKLENLKEVRQTFSEFSDRRFKSALATALTRTAVQVRDEVKAELPKAFDRPTPYTMRQLKYVAATAEKTASAVGFNIVAVTDIRGAVISYRDLGPGETPAGKYLQPNIQGGQRDLKRLEVALRAAGALPVGMIVIPGQGAKIDGYGNVARGQVVQVLSQLRIQLVAGTNRNMSADRRKQIKAQERAGGRFFVVRPGSAKIQPGIYQREFIGNNITPVFIFARVSSAKYKQRFNFNGITRKVSDRVLPFEMNRALQDSLLRLLKSRKGATVNP